MAKSLFDLTLEEYKRTVEINQVSVFLGMKAVAPSMKKAGSGSIVNISSMNGLVGGAIGYTDTKFAVRGMTKAAALNLSPMGIRVTLYTQVSSLHQWLFKKIQKQRWKSSRKAFH